MAVAVVTINPTIGRAAYVTGKYVCDAAPSATNINIGFVPSRVEVANITDSTTFSFYTSDMAAGTGVKVVAAAGPVAIASGGITAVTQTDGTNHGFSIGTDAGVQIANKTFSFIAFR